VFAHLPADVEALAIVTATPIASQDPDGQTQRLMGQRTDDIEASGGATRRNCSARSRPRTSPTS
jgi:hypothetical protein